MFDRHEMYKKIKLLIERNKPVLEQKKIINQFNELCHDIDIDYSEITEEDD